MRRKPEKFTAVLLIILCFSFYIKSFGANIQKDTIKITLEQAHQLILKKNLTYKNSELDLQKAKLEKSTAFGLGTTDLDFQYGNINSSALDYYIQINQNIGNPLEKIAMHRLYKQKILLQQQNLELQKKQLEYQIDFAFNDYLYWAKTVQFYSQIYRLYMQAVKILEQKSGKDTTQSSDLQLIQNQAQNFRWQFEEAKVNLADVLAKINYLLGTDSTVYLPELQNINFSLNSEVIAQDQKENPQLKYQQAKLEVAKNSINVLKTQLFPEISIGYFNQQIDYVPGLQGIDVALSFNLDIFTLKKQQKIAYLDYQVQQNEYEQTKEKLKYEYNSLLNHYFFLKQKLNYYQAITDKTLNNILSECKQEIDSKNFDYEDFADKLNSAIEIEQQYLSTLKDYNTAIIELNLY